MNNFIMDKNKKIVIVAANDIDRTIAENALIKNNSVALVGIIKCPFCESKNTEDSMFLKEWDCLNCLKPFKGKDFL